MLPIDYHARKAIPLYDFLTGYFPDALVELTKVSVEGNTQHNPGEPLHWARGKSMDQLNTAMRHMFDHKSNPFDTDGCYHLAKAAWRLLAEVQLMCEARDKEVANPAGRALGSGQELPSEKLARCVQEAQQEQRNAQANKFGYIHIK